MSTPPFFLCSSEPPHEPIGLPEGSLDIAWIETISYTPGVIEPIVYQPHQTADDPAACPPKSPGYRLNQLILILIVHKMQLFVFDGFNPDAQIQN
jgi:hypothetical protein